MAHFEYELCVHHSRSLLAHDYSKPVPPILCQAYPHDFQIRRKVSQQRIRGGMKSQSGSHQVNDRRGLLQLDPAEVSVSSKIALFQVPAHAQPVVRSLQRKVYVLAGFQLKNCQAAVGCHRQHVENPMFTTAVGEDLRIHKALIERGIDPRDVLAH